MANQDWVGFSIIANCGERLGSFRGLIVAVSDVDQSLTLANAERNGIPCTSSGITLRAQDIKQLKILEAAAAPICIPVPVPAQSALPAQKSAFHPTSPQVNKVKPTGMHNTSSFAPFAEQPPQSPHKLSAEEFAYRMRATAADGNRSPNKKDRQRQRWTDRDEAAFGSPIDNAVLEEEFDFEKNLALFDKQAVYQKIVATQKPEAVQPSQQKYRHDENVIEAAPTRYHQIKVPFQDSPEYVTDAGLVIPSISLALRNQLLGLAERLSLSFERQAELMGRAATETALHLMGGGHRLNPHNVHQWPTVVALCGSHRNGVLGANCARHLASHGIRVLLLAPDSGTPIPPELYRELSLFRLTKNPILKSVTELPAHAVDLIILTVDDTRGQGLAPSWLPAAAAWANESRAPVLAIDPPIQGSGVNTKLSLVGALPLAHGAANGKIYLCNLGIPVNVYEEVGITYNSPFGPKFVIPLHPNNA